MPELTGITILITKTATRYHWASTKYTKTIAPRREALIDIDDEGHLQASHGTATSLLQNLRHHPSATAYDTGKDSR